MNGIYLPLFYLHILWIKEFIIMILACNNISKSFGTDEILKHVSFHINDREKAAIVGINGSGKSTLLKIIMGESKADEGEVIFSKGASVGYLAQHQELSSERTIFEEMLEVKKDVIELDKQIRQLEIDMKEAQGEALDKLLKLYTNLTHTFEMKNGYAYQSEVIGVLKGLGFSEDDFQKKTSTLSGGQKTRVSLGKLLLSTPDIILLDEPTNHLDLSSIAWLETYLLNYKGAVVIVAHDRYFLDKVVTKIIELEHTKAQAFLGNYSEYAYKKEMQRNALVKQYLNQQREIKHQEEVITKLRSFNREKSIRRAESRDKLLDKIERIEKPITEEAQMFFQLEPSITSGNDVLSVKDLSKSFGAKRLFEHIHFDIKKGEKVAIIGSNGTGKTTILKIINELVEPDSGEIKLGAKVKIGYYDQEHQVLHMEKTLFEELQDTYPNMDNTSIRNVLAAFLFTNDDVFKRIKDLSGGERGRVSLAKLMLSEANFLILDEPTNHLDITSKEILENAIRHYTGTVLYVSHDRYFINKTATRILDLTQEHLLNYIGNYDYYLEKKEEVEAAYLNLDSTKLKIPQGGKGSVNAISYLNEKLEDSSDSNLKNVQATATTNKQPSTERFSSDTKLDWKQQKEEQARLRKQQNELKKCEDEITELENRNAAIDELLTKEEIYTNVSELMKLNQEKKELEERLEELMVIWEELV